MFFLLSLCSLSNGKLKLKQHKMTDITELFLGAFTVQCLRSVMSFTVPEFWLFQGQLVTAFLSLSSSSVPEFLLDPAQLLVCGRDRDPVCFFLEVAWGLMKD